MMLSIFLNNFDGQEFLIINGEANIVLIFCAPPQEQTRLKCKKVEQHSHRARKGLETHSLSLSLAALERKRKVKEFCDDHKAGK